MSLSQPDPELLRRAQKGDERAFTAIMRAYETPIHNYIFRLTGDRTLAEDLTQEVFVRVLHGLPRFSLRCKFTTWLFQVTKNRVLDEFRARERRPQVVTNLDDLPQVESFDQPVDVVVDRELVVTHDRGERALIAALSPAEDGRIRL